MHTRSRYHVEKLKTCVMFLDQHMKYVPPKMDDSRADDRRHRTRIYELHVNSATIRHFRYAFFWKIRSRALLFYLLEWRAWGQNWYTSATISNSFRYEHVSNDEYTENIHNLSLMLIRIEQNLLKKYDLYSIILRKRSFNENDRLTSKSCKKS